ncbi:MAG: histidine phosphatase family protein [Clostridia bacterium]|nr:histidine phosphatase family protein [Clostridia bacterium]
MTDLYIVRHCEAVGNRDRTFQGVSDCDITELGQKQLDHLAERFKDIKIDTVYSSPLKRAYLTAAAANKYHNLPIEKMDDLIEIDGGEIEGICWVDFPETRPELEYAWSMEPHNFHPKGGESMRSVYTRSWRAVKEIVAKNSGKTALLASHGCTIRNIICNALGRPVEQLNTVNWADNTGVFLLRFDGDKLPEILIFNDVSHLPEDCLPAKSRITSLFAKKPVIKKVEEK